MTYFKLIILFILMIPQQKIKETQLSHARVKQAYADREQVVKGYFEHSKVSYKGFNLFLRAFKKEAVLEVWIKPEAGKKFQLLHTYEICAGSGTLGPKRREGDNQVPEGVYKINHFNPQSNFYLSLGLNYPNASDKMLSDKIKPGGDIYIHGDCVTIGCIPLTDEKIKEVYIMAVETANNGQTEIPVHIFPARLTVSEYNQIARDFPAHKAFWKNLQTIYNDFERTNELKAINVDSKGLYKFQ